MTNNRHPEAILAIKINRSMMMGELNPSLRNLDDLISKAHARSLTWNFTSKAIENPYMTNAGAALFINQPKQYGHAVSGPIRPVVLGAGTVYDR